VFDISDFCNRYKLKPTECFSALKTLQLNEYISLSDALLSPSKLMVKVSNDVLYKFQLKNPRFEKLLQILLRSYSGIFEVITKIDEQVIAKRLNTKASEITVLLNELKTLELIDYEPKTDLPKITYLTERKNHKNLHISPESYQIRKRQAEKKIDAMVSYCTKTDMCRSRLLLAYFGEITDKTCGICDVCTGRNDASKSNKDVARVEKKIIKILTENEHLTLSNLVMQLSDEKKSLIIEALRFMMDEKKIKHDKGRYLL
jgi:ATP-dependent DNA helicase RecQ